MARVGIGDQVRVALPQGKSKRGVPGISVMFFTSMEARFEGATGTVTEINPRGPYGLPVMLVDFTTHKNKVAVPWQQHWFRDEWLLPAEVPADPTPVDRTSSATGQGQTAAGISS